MLRLDYKAGGLLIFVPMSAFWELNWSLENFHGGVAHMPALPSEGNLCAGSTSVGSPTELAWIRASSHDNELPLPLPQLSLLSALPLLLRFEG
jgi:hypothetical protein